jgi:hypothetical protein
MSEHKVLFSLIVLASFTNLGWVLIIYVLSFHGARSLVDGISGYDQAACTRVLACPARKARKGSLPGGDRHSSYPSFYWGGAPTWCGFSALPPSGAECSP